MAAPGGTDFETVVPDEGTNARQAPAETSQERDTTRAKAKEGQGAQRMPALSSFSAKADANAFVDRLKLVHSSEKLASLAARDRERHSRLDSPR